MHDSSAFFKFFLVLVLKRGVWAFWISSFHITVSKFYHGQDIPIDETNSWDLQEPLNFTFHNQTLEMGLLSRFVSVKYHKKRRRFSSKDLKSHAFVWVLVQYLKLFRLARSWVFWLNMSRKDMFTCTDFLFWFYVRFSIVTATRRSRFVVHGTFAFFPFLFSWSEPVLT